MNISDILRQATVSRLDVEVLLAHVLGRDRAWLAAHGDKEVPPEIHAAFTAAVARRKAHEPVAYITGEREFYGRSFHVTPDVLIPRPATEGLVDFVLDTLSQRTRDRVRVVDAGIVAASSVWGSLEDARTIVDVGTGSGCIAVTLACENPGFRVIAVDVSKNALAIARKNAKKHGVANRIDLRQGHLLEPVKTFTDPFIVVANPPYIPDSDVLPPDVENYEPSLALRAGKEGLDIIRELMTQVHAHPQCRGLVLECKEKQWFIVCGS